MDAETKAILERVARSLERLADRYAPEKAKTEVRPASLSTATYTREEREMRDFKAGVAQTGPPGHVTGPTRTDLGTS